MIFTKDLIFIHVGKTGGMSCSVYFLENLQPPVYNCHQEVFDQINSLEADGIIPISDINRHCNLAEALEYIKKFDGRQLEDFKKVVAVIRHPYMLEFSHYTHLRKPKVRNRRGKYDPSTKLADGDFKTFVEKAGYHRKNHTQDDFVRINDEIPSCVELVKFEQLSDAFPKAVSNFIKKGATFTFPRRNKTEYQTNIRDELTDDVKELIYRKHKFIFDSGLYSPIG